MSVKEWSDDIVLAELQDDPLFSEDLNTLQELAEVQRGKHFVLNLSEVNFLNSSNIAKLLKLRKLTNVPPPTKLRLCCISTAVWGVFLVTGLDKIFDFCDDIPSALTSIQIDSSTDKTD